MSARLIDPNPTLGITDPAYDYGKFLHFLEPVGWVRARPESCSARWTAPRGGGRWCLDAEMQNLPRRREMARSAMEADIHRAAERSLGAHDSDWKRALGVATASAHLGLARLAAESGDRKACRFALAYALRRMVG